MGDCCCFISHLLTIHCVIYCSVNDVLVAVVNDMFQLNRAKQERLILVDFEEGSLNFKPTFKYDIGSHEYDTR